MRIEYLDRYVTLGLKIAYYRKKSNLTQEGLAEKAGISLNFLAQIEAPGTRTGLSLDTLFAIAEALNVSPSKLLEDD